MSREQHNAIKGEDGVPTRRNGVNAEVIFLKIILSYFVLVMFF